MSFIGEYEVTMDAKGRFSLPAGFRKQLSEGAEANGFVISRGLGSFLNLYTRAEWDAYASKLSRLNEFNRDAQKLKRILLSGATELHLDSAGRVLIPKQLQEFGGFSKLLIFSAMGNKVELWDKDKYNDYLKIETDSIEELGSKLFGTDLMDPFESPTNTTE